ncbi:hypothetical protein JCM11641_001970 [Rhodosporidiobolus odoratus]
MNPPTTLPSHLLHLSTLLLLSRSSSHSSTSSSTTTPAPGFTHSKSLPLHTLSHLLRDYLCLLATTAQTAAETAGRHKSSVWDLAHALDDLGFRGLNGIRELRDEAETADAGVEEEADRVRELALGLQDHLNSQPQQAPLAQLTYDPLRPDELSLLYLVASLPPEGAPTPSISSPSSSSSTDDDQQDDAELASPPPAPPTPLATSPEKPLPPPHDLGLGPGTLGDLSLDGLGDLGLLTHGLSAGAGDAAFFDSLGLDPSSSTSGSTAAAAAAAAVAPGGLNGIEGVGDLPVNLFAPLDLSGRPISDLSLLAPLLPNLDLDLDVEPEEETEEDLRPYPPWRDSSLIPAYVPSHLPPFPGCEKETSSALTRRRKREAEKVKEKEREAKEAAAANANAPAAAVGRAAAALMAGGGAAGDPWEEAIPYSSSSLAQMANEFANSLPTPSSPHRLSSSLDNESLPNGDRGQNGSGGQGGGEGQGQGGEEGGDEASRKRKRRRRSLSPPSTSTTSLQTFTSLQPLLSHPPTSLRPSTLRRLAASYISPHPPSHPELQISTDSLFGSLPYAIPLRQATLPPGFLPDVLGANSAMHPFNSTLPWTVSMPVPYRPAVGNEVLSAPGPNGRAGAMASIVRELSSPLQFDMRPNRQPPSHQPSQRSNSKNKKQQQAEQPQSAGAGEELHPNIALFSRLRRIGPPAPLGPKGEATNYEYVGNTALVALSGVEWAERRWDAKLPPPKPVGGGSGGAGEEGKSSTVGGIKLKLGGGGVGRGAREGSQVGGGAGGTPGPATPATGMTPAPSYSNLGASTLIPSDGFDLSSSDIRASVPPASTSSSSSLPATAPTPALPEADFPYPDFLASLGHLGSLSALSTTSGAFELGGTVEAFDWAGLGVGVGGRGVAGIGENGDKRAIGEKYEAPQGEGGSGGMV